jgi:hypothetical protein
MMRFTTFSISYRADVTDFNYAIGLDKDEVIAGFIGTIKGHHPGEVIWVQQ